MVAAAAAVPAATAPASFDVLADIVEVDVRHGVRVPLVYDAAVDRYVSAAGGGDGTGSGSGSGSGASGPARRRHRPPVERLRRLVARNLVPEGVVPSYYRYIRWRNLQRFVNANVHVFGTQSLLLGLGIKNRNALGLGAALNWVLKDALGKLVRMAWASRMGRKFDPDAKRWRYRSAFVFAAGNGLEVMTYVCPPLFLLCATLANCCKQVSMLTSSATRTALLNSFRDGSRENIGDITAKGEAQIAIVDLLGIASGVALSRAVGVGVRSVLAVWAALQAVEMVCMYHEIRSVVFRMLNFDRLHRVVADFVRGAEEELPPANGGASVAVPTPEEVADAERIFLPPERLARAAVAFGSLGRARLGPDELAELAAIFGGERYLLVAGANRKRAGGEGEGGGRRLLRRILPGGRKRDRAEAAQEHCHIVLHADAGSDDIVKGTLALAILRRGLAARVVAQEEDAVGGEGSGLDSEPPRTGDCLDLIRAARDGADRLLPDFLAALTGAGWAPRKRYIFGRVTMRTEWPLLGEEREASERT